MYSIIVLTVKLKQSNAIILQESKNTLITATKNGFDEKITQ